MLRSILASGSEWKGNVYPPAASTEPGLLVRSYEIDGPTCPGGIRIRDRRTGQVIEGNDAMAVLDRGEIERLKRP